MPIDRHPSMLYSVVVVSTPSRPRGTIGVPSPLARKVRPAGLFIFAESSFLLLQRYFCSVIVTSDRRDQEGVLNSLNSVLIEGALIQDPVMVEKFGKPVCTFKLVSTRYAKNDEGERVQALSFFEIDVHNRAEASKCMADLKEGRGVRVVGRMMTESVFDRDNVAHHKMIIIGESVSIKPMFDRVSEVQS